MQELRNHILFILLGAILAIGVGCDRRTSVAALDVRLPERSEGGVALTPASGHESFFEVSVRAADLDAPVVVTGTPGETVRLSVPAGRARTVVAQLFPDSDATAPSHQGTAGPMNLKAGERRRVSVDLYALDLPTAVAPELYAGGVAACAVTGEVRELGCWGWNWLEGLFGPELQQVTVTEPTVRRGLEQDVIDVAISVFHGCAVVQGGDVYCWGYNTAGQLGKTASPVLEPAPVRVEGLAGPAKQVVSGADYTCVLLEDGAVQCFGGNEDGQLGIGNLSTSVSRPAQPVGLDRGVVTLTASAALEGDQGLHTCALMEDATVRCWGNNYSGQVGSGSVRTTVSEPTAVEGLSRVVAIAAGGANSCAVNADGELYCWGVHDGAVLAPSPATQSTVRPQRMGGFSAAVSQVAVDAGYACALLVVGDLYCWGTNNWGQSGVDLGTPVVETPTLVPSPSGGWVDVDLAFAHACGRTSADTLYCWGLNAIGALGNGTGGFRLTPQRAAGQWSDISIGNEHICGVDASGVVSCWGTGGYELLVDTLKPQQSPHVIPGIASGVTVEVGRSSACVLTDLLELFCWGDNSSGQIGVGSTASVVGTPTQVPDASGFEVWLSVNLDSDGSHVCGYQEVEGTGELYCWGENYSGQVGVGTFLSPVTNATYIAFNWQRVDVGEAHTCSVDGNNAVLCWGNNGTGQVGVDPALMPTTATPLLVSGLGTPVVDISAGTHHTCALIDESIAAATGGGSSADHSLWCWGDNTEGALGLGMSAPSTHVPTQVGSDLDWFDVEAADGYTCALKTDGTLWCWGSNHAGDTEMLGRLGLGYVGYAYTPQQVGSDSDWVELELGNELACARKADDTLWCWGAEFSGQFGLETAWSHTPTRVAFP